MIRFRRQPFDWTIVSVAVIILSLGVATIYTITSATVGTSLSFSQLTYAVIGLGLLMFFAVFDYRHLKAWSWAGYGLGLVLLVPLLPALARHLPLVICEFNACRWLNLGLFRFQTSEVVKLAVLILLAAIASRARLRPTVWLGAAGLGLVFVPAALIVRQPDLGTAVVMSLSGLLIIARLRLPWTFWAALVVVVALAAPVAWHWLQPYQKTRVEIFLNPNLDPDKTGYNVRQAEIAVGSGALSGRGFGRGSQSQLNFLPVAHTDFIFAGYAEATGFVGSIGLLALYAVIIFRALLASEQSRDRFGQILVYGIAVQLAIQVAINIGMNVRLFPVTGVPLPLMSFGGTSVFVTCISLGIVESVAARRHALRFD